MRKRSEPTAARSAIAGALFPTAILHYLTSIHSRRTFVMSTLEMELTNFSHCIEYGARGPDYETDIAFARILCASEHRRVWAYSNAALHSTRTPAAASVILDVIPRYVPTYRLFFKYLFSYSSSARSLRAAVACQAQRYPPGELNRIVRRIARLAVSSGI